MRSSLRLLGIGVAVMLIGGYLIGLWAVGAVLLLLGAALALVALLRDDGQPSAATVENQAPTVHPSQWRPAFNEQESIDRIFEHQQVIP